MKRIRNVIMVVLTFFSFNNIYGQSQKLDSLWDIFKKTKFDTIRCNIYLEIGNLYLFNNPDSAIYYFNKCLQLAELKKIKPQQAISLRNIGFVNKDQGNYNNAMICFDKSLMICNQIGNQKGVASCYLYMGLIYWQKTNYHKALELFYKSLLISKKYNDKRGISACYTNIGIIYWEQSIYDLSIEFFLKSLKISEELGDKLGISNCLANIGIIQTEQGNYDKALDYLLKSLKILEELNNEQGISRCYSNIGIVYINKADYNKALEYFNSSLKISEKLQDKKGLSQSYNNLGTICEKQGKYDLAMEYYMKSLNLYNEIGDTNGVVINYASIASLNLYRFDYEKNFEINKSKYLNNAIDYANKAIIIAHKNNIQQWENNAAQTLMNAHKKKGDFRKAMEYSEIYIATKNEMFNKEKSNALANAETKYNAEKKQKEIESLNKDKAIQKYEIERQTTQKYIFILGFSLMLILAFVVFRSYRQKRKDNFLLSEQKQVIEDKNDELNQQNEEIKTQRDEIEAQRDMVTSQKTHIEEILQGVHQSIDYAKRIQTSILPETSLLDKFFNEYFILYKPKDIVSGDFYWWAEVEEQVIVAVADCTGHGVPGAFMTMLGTSFLREIVQKEYITNSAVILRKLRKEIIKTLKQKGIEGEQKDGMDMALVSINKETKLVHFSGAQNSLYIVRNPSDNKQEEKFLVEIKADKMPIAIYDQMDQFTNHEIQLNKGDMMYMFSDGYADQFGGPNNKKFLSKNFRQLIYKVRLDSMEEQRVQINKALESWKGTNEQIDDITILGLKI
jgi:serine phosphatase RsbU (regulator of sigma subunit)/tetratricopeptide (TPR) repeat protein